jgi:hypothetical protein
VKLNPKLPFLVSPYPNEILGSWLYRLRVHNHASLLWLVSGLRKLGNLERSEWRDIAKRNSELERFFGALGTSYEEVMMELSTYPYWLRFHSEHRFCWPGAATEFPALILRNRRKSLSRLSFLSPSLVRLCSQCLDEDFEQYGEPYLHRAHLLPFVSVCHKHRTPLVSRCDRCRQIFRMESTFIGAQLTCECGYDLRTAPLTPCNGKEWESLACYSADVLFDKDTFHDCSTFYRFLDARLAAHAVERRPDLLTHLTLVYGEEAAKAILSLWRQGSDAYSYSPIGWIGRRELRAPQICALLASLDPSFADSQVQFGRFRETAEVSSIRSCRSTRLPRIPRSITEARSFVVEAQQSVNSKSITRSFLYWRYKTLFWYLVLFDCEWFDANFPPGGRGAPEILPSIESDRTQILRAIKKTARPSVRIWKNLAQQAFFRALLRDNQWLEDRKRETARAAHAEKLVRKQERLKACAEEIRRAIEYARTIKGGYILSVSKFAPYSSLSQAQLRHLFASNPEMRQLLRFTDDVCSVSSAVSIQSGAEEHRQE